MIDFERLYTKHARRFDQVRAGSRMELPYLIRAHEVSGGNESMLDLGCGSGEPIARFFAERDYAVTGVDLSSEMLRLAIGRFPEMKWIPGDMRELDLEHQFDVVIAWDSFFHLSPEDQREMFPVFKRHLRIGGALMFTSGVDAGEEVGGDLFGDELYHASLASAEYAEQLTRNGCAVILHQVEDPDCGGHTVWIAQRQW